MAYNKAKIYKIHNIIDNEIYIGSTRISLANRMAKHRFTAREERRNCHRLYMKMNDLGIDKFYIELIEEYPCENVEQLRRHEGEIIRELKPSLNFAIAGRTNKEWREDNAEYKKEKDKEYYQEHQEIIKERSKRYRQDNREVMIQQNKEYYQKKREELKEKVECECGAVCSKYAMPKHKKSLKHQQAMEQL